MSSVPRTLVVGDVHGCVAELDALLRVVGFGAGDRLVFVGDLVAKGPDSAGVVARARSLAARSVLGNHETKVMSFRAAERAGEALPKLGRPHRDVVDALSAEDWAYLEALPYLIELEEHAAVVVHAGVDPSRALHAQDPGVVTNVRSFRPDGTPTSRIEEGVAWASKWEGPRKVIFGHDAIRGLQIEAFALGLDTGCVYGGALTCVELPTWRRYSVPARKAWCDR